MKSLVFSPTAVADIDRIFNYTEENWGSEQAENYIFSLRDACRSLSMQEKHGRRFDGIKRGYLVLPCGSHFIVYKESRYALVIVRILHQRMNIGMHL